jgi:hypothetical protein
LAAENLYNHVDAISDLESEISIKNLNIKDLNEELEGALEGGAHG